jgi:hypothetical protein
MTRHSTLLFLLFIVAYSSCTSKKSKSDIEVLFTQDTLNVGYTYWWPQSGPFIGACGEELSLVFEGTVTSIKESTDDPGPLYISQEGIIELEKVFKIKNLEANTYAGQKFVSTDCFYESNIAVGDKVVVFCYDYQGAYTIPGKYSIVKVAALDFSTVASIKTYIDADQNPLSIKKDLELWSTHGFEESLVQIIDCKEELNKAIK